MDECACVHWYRTAFEAHHDAWPSISYNSMAFLWRGTSLHMHFERRFDPIDFTFREPSCILFGINDLGLYLGKITTLQIF